MFIKVSSYWPEQGDGFVGPVTKAEAQRLCAQAISDKDSEVIWSWQQPRDLRNGIKVTIITNKAARSRICNDPPNANILTAIPPSAYELGRELDCLNNAGE